MIRTKYTVAKLKPIVQQSYCWSDVARSVGVCTTGGTIRAHLRKVCDFLEIDYSHFLGAKALSLRKADPEIVLQKGTKFGRSFIKRTVMDNSLLPEVCKICGLEPYWKRKPLTLVLDHINGDPTDHRIKNLRLVCPNCDSQLPTSKGRKNKGKKKTRSTGHKPILSHLDKPYRR